MNELQKFQVYVGASKEKANQTCGGMLVLDGDTGLVVASQYWAKGIGTRYFINPDNIIGHRLEIIDFEEVISEGQMRDLPPHVYRVTFEEVR